MFTKSHLEQLWRFCNAVKPESLYHWLGLVDYALIGYGNKEIHCKSHITTGYNFLRVCDSRHPRSILPFIREGPKAKPGITDMSSNRQWHWDSVLFMCCLEMTLPYKNRRNGSFRLYCTDSLPSLIGLSIQTLTFAKYINIFILIS